MYVIHLLKSMIMIQFKIHHIAYNVIISSYIGNISVNLSINRTNRGLLTLVSKPGVQCSNHN